MKKLIAVLFIALMVGLGDNAWSLSWGDVRDEFQENVRVNVLSNAAPVHLYNMRKGRSEGGVQTTVGWYRFISADIGWATPFESSQKGTIIGGASLHIDKLITQTWPAFSDLTNAFIPRSAERFWDKLFVGFYFGRNIDDSDLDFGISSGLAFKF